jgi:hypothetical protein
MQLFSIDGAGRLSGQELPEFTDCRLQHLDDFILAGW